MHGVTCRYVPGSGMSPINLLEYPHFIHDMSPFFDYSHSVLTSYGRIVGFSSEETQSREIVINVAHESCSEAEFLKAKEQLFLTFERDVLMQTPGTLYVNGYSIKCYFISEHVDSRFDIASQSTFTVIWEQREKWRKDLKTVHFSSALAAPEEISVPDDQAPSPEVAQPTNVSEDKKFNYGYNYGYPFPFEKLEFINPSDIDLSFRVRLYGPWVTPGIWVGNNLYGLTRDLLAGDVVEINGLDKTVTNQGNNWFMYLDKTQNPFGRIPPQKSEVLIRANDHILGTVVEQTPSTYDCWLTIVDEREVPAWI